MRTAFAALLAGICIMPSYTLAVQRTLDPANVEDAGAIHVPADPQRKADLALAAVRTSSDGQDGSYSRQAGEGGTRLANGQESQAPGSDVNSNDLDRAPPKKAAQGNGSDAEAVTSADGIVRLTVGRLDDYVVIDGDGNRLGEVEGVARVEGQLYAIIEFGGVWGFGEDRAAIPFSELFVDDRETLVAPNMRKQGLEVLADDGSDRYASLPRNHEFTLPSL